MRKLASARTAGAACLLGLAVLAACASGPEPVACPVAAILKDTSLLTRYRGGGRDLTDIALRAQISDVAQSCQRIDNVVDVGLAVRIVADRGPASTAGEAPVRYFVAIIDPQRRVLAREAFDVVLPFGEGTKVIMRDEVNPRLPLPEGVEATNYSIYVGFVLSRAELDYNRRNP